MTELQSLKVYVEKSQKLQTSRLVLARIGYGNFRD